MVLLLLLLLFLILILIVILIVSVPVQPLPDYTLCFNRSEFSTAGRPMG